MMWPLVEEMLPGVAVVMLACAEVALALSAPSETARTRQK
jgi:hypothetical protein